MRGFFKKGVELFNIRRFPAPCAPGIERINLGNQKSAPQPQFDRGTRGFLHGKGVRPSGHTPAATEKPFGQGCCHIPDVRMAAECPRVLWQNAPGAELRNAGGVGQTHNLIAARSSRREFTMATLVIKNIGKIVSGDIDHPVLEGSVIVINENLIEAIGGEELLANVGDATVVDANGTTVTPGLWDTHVHVSTADGYGTRQKTFGFIESAKNGGVTTMISAGECHIPGHPI